MEQEIDSWLGATSAVIWALYQFYLIGRAIHLTVNLCCKSHLWSLAVDSDRKNKTLNTSGQNELALNSGCAHSWGLGSVCTEKSQLKFLEDLLRMPSKHLTGRVFFFLYEIRLGLTQDSPDRIHLLVGLGAAHCLSCVLEEGGLKTSGQTDLALGK